MVKKYRKHIIWLVILSALTHFSYFAYPDQLVFDEVHFAKFASTYSTGKYYFDVHPPLSKLIFAAAGYIGGFDPTTTDYSQIGNTFGQSNYFWFRLPTMFAGFLLPLVIFFFAMLLGISPRYSFLAGLLIIFENSLLVESRYVLLDPMLIFFGFTSLSLYLLSNRYSGRTARYILILSAFFAIFTFSIKWTGLSFVGLIFLFEFIQLIRVRTKKQWQEFFKKCLVYAVVGFTFYYFIFAIHFALLPKSGEGDDFMTESFQKELVENVNQNKDVPLLSPFQKFIELNHVMYTANSGLTATHQYGSRWYTWPIMLRPIYYWNDQANSPANSAMIYLLGNPFIYWLSVLAIVILLFRLLCNFVHRQEKHLSAWAYYESNRAPILILIGYFANLLPFALISRVEFLYHYESSLVFAILALVYLADVYFVSRKSQKIFFGSILLISILAFLYFAPLSYGLPMKESDLLQRFWVSSWR